MSDDRVPMNIFQQADFLDHLVNRTTTRTGATAAETMMLLTASDVEDLQAVAARLRRMGPHENAIRRVVMGK